MASTVASCNYSTTWIWIISCSVSWQEPRLPGITSQGHDTQGLLSSGRSSVSRNKRQKYLLLVVMELRKHSCYGLNVCVSSPTPNSYFENLALKGDGLYRWAFSPVLLLWQLLRHFPHMTILLRPNLHPPEAWFSYWGTVWGGPGSHCGPLLSISGVHATCVPLPDHDLRSSLLLFFPVVSNRPACLRKQESPG